MNLTNSMDFFTQLNINPIQSEKEVEKIGDTTILQRCKTCNEPILILKNGYEFSVDCECMRKYRQLQRLKKFSDMSITDRDSGNDIFQNASFSNDEEKRVYELAKKYCDSFEKALINGKGLLFSGTCGTGKTFLANCICNELKEKGYGILSFSMSSYFNKIRKSVDDEEKLKEAIKTADLLFIDDLGSEQINRKDGALWGEEKLFNLFDIRYRAKKPILITTNLNSEQLKEHIKINGTDKIFSRLNEMISRAFVFNFEDKRKNKEFNF